VQNCASVFLIIKPIGAKFNVMRKFAHKKLNYLQPKIAIFVKL